jgi:hypothetical protein
VKEGTGVNRRDPADVYLANWAVRRRRSASVIAAWSLPRHWPSSALRCRRRRPVPAFHLDKIREVYPGAVANPASQYVALQMPTAGEPDFRVVG